jgi:hypothetical protein
MLMLALALLHLGPLDKHQFKEDQDQLVEDLYLPEAFPKIMVPIREEPLETWEHYEALNLNQIKLKLPHQLLLLDQRLQEALLLRVLHHKEAHLEELHPQ